MCLRQQQKTPQVPEREKLFEYSKRILEFRDKQTALKKLLREPNLSILNVS